jgi:hypothetical protein
MELKKFVLGIGIWYLEARSRYWDFGNICFKFSLECDVGKQLLIANDRNKVRWLVLVLLQDGACMNLYENRSENSLKGDPSNDTTVNPSLFSSVNTFTRRTTNALLSTLLYGFHITL